MADPIQKDLEGTAKALAGGLEKTGKVFVELLQTRASTDEQRGVIDSSAEFKQALEQTNVNTVVDASRKRQDKIMGVESESDLNVKEDQQPSGPSPVKK